MITFLSMKLSISNISMVLNIGLLFFCLLLWKRNQQLNQQILKLQKETKEILERKIIKESPQDLVSIKNISTSKTIKTTSPQTTKLLKEQTPNFIPPVAKEASTYPKPSPDKTKSATKDPQKEVLAKEKSNISTIKGVNSDITPPTQIPTPKITSSPKFKETPSKKAYQKNVLQNKNTITSPISISNEDTFNMNKLSFDLNEFIKKSEKIVPKIKETAPKKDYLKELSDQMAKELQPQTIELTDYEKEQEEHAIISYQELLAVKDKLTMLDDETETVDFIEELKNFRNSLN